MKKSILLFIIWVGCNAYAQVGVNTTQPKATVDIRSRRDTAIPDGVLIPRLDGNEIKNMNVDSEQISMIVYAETRAENSGENTPADIRSKNIDEKGFYHWDGTYWQKVVSNDWKVGGNTNSSTIGTLDSNPLLFIVEGIKAGRIDKFSSSTSGNVAFGLRSLEHLYSGKDNVAIGHVSGNNISSGSGNVAIGYQSLLSNTTGNNNIAIGNAAGHKLKNGARVLTTGSNNVMIGNNTIVNDMNGSNQININNIMHGKGSRIGIGPAYFSQFDNGGNPIITGKELTETFEVDGNILTNDGIILQENISTTILENASCSKNGKIVYKNGFFYGCASGLWKKLNM